MKLSVPTKRIMLAICIIAVAIIAAGVVIYMVALSLPASALYFALGVILTSSLNVVQMYMLERAVQKTVQFEEGSAGKSYLSMQYLVRFAITAAVLVAAGVLGEFVLHDASIMYGAIAGVFTLQIAALLVGLLRLDGSREEATDHRKPVPDDEADETEADGSEPDESDWNI
jgi:hypothetical protein